MKTFHYKHGRVAISAMTVSELQELLSAYPADMPVFATWEGQIMPLGHHHHVQTYSVGIEPEACECLVLDAENNK